MKRVARGSTARSVFDFIEEATHLLRTAPGSALAAYYLGSLPFVLGLLYFWADMGRSPFARRHVVEAALGMAALFVWMKFWQSIFAQRLHAALAGEPPAALGWRCGLRLLVAQAAVQPTALFVLPLTFATVVTFPWTCAFYQSVTALAADDSGELRPLLHRAARQTVLWPRENCQALVILFGFGFFVFVNCASICLLLPALLKTLLGVETAFSVGIAGMANTTFFTAMFGLTYLCLDPLLKAVFVLRCFYGESLQSGLDLKVSLRRVAQAVPRAVACLGAGVMLCGVAAPRQSAAFFGGEEPDGGALPGCRCEAVAVTAAATPASSATSGLGSSPQADKADRAPGVATVSAAQLDRSLGEVLQQNKYVWRLSREVVEEEQELGVIGRFLEQAREMVRKGVLAVRDWVEAWFRKLFNRDRPDNGGDQSGYGWMVTQQLLLYGLVIGVGAVLGLLLYRTWRDRQRKAAAVVAEAVTAAPDIADENVGADQLPEDGWTRMARELLEKGELRLALRAFYLASLASLAANNLITLAKFKSNRDYERELGRRAHAFAGLLSVFGENVATFDRVWYGLHEVDAEIVQHFAANVEQIKSGG